MLRVHIKNDSQDFAVEHPGGRLLFGRAPTGDCAICTIQDPYVSRNQFTIEENDSGVTMVNLSSSNPLTFSGGSSLATGQKMDCSLPLAFQIGRSKIEITPILIPISTGRFTPESQVDMDLDSGECRSFIECSPFRNAPAQAETRDVSTENSRILLALECINQFESSSLATPAGYQKVAQALAQMARLDLGMVVLHQKGNWVVAGTWAQSDTVNVRISRSLMAMVLQKRKTFYQDLRQLQNGGESLMSLSAAVVSPIFGVKGEVIGALYGVRMKSAVLVGGITNLEAQVVQALASILGGSMAREQAIRSRIQFEQFFSQDLVRELENNPDLLKGRLQDVTVLFSDLRGFTALSGRLAPQDICALLQDVMEVLSEQIQLAGGVIVDYAGDGILAMWNAPVLQVDHAQRALNAALGMIRQMEGVNQRWKWALEDRPLGVGIGINSGEALVGNTGSMRKFKYGPLGLSVNLASRVQDVTKRVGSPILITEATRARLAPDLQVRRIGSVLLAGVPDPIVLYEFPWNGPNPQWLMDKFEYEQTLDLFENGRIEEAQQRASASNDSFMKHMAHRCQEILVDGKERNGMILIHQK